jgi:hypothetical protein
LSVPGPARRTTLPAAATPMLLTIRYRDGIFRVAPHRQEQDIRAVITD